MSHSLTKKRPAKKIKNNFWEKNLFWAAVAAEGVQGGLAHGRKGGGGDKQRENLLQSCFYCTHQVFCAVGARPPRPATTTAAATAATATTTITGVVRLCNATRRKEKGERVRNGVLIAKNSDAALCPLGMRNE